MANATSQAWICRSFVFLEFFEDWLSLSILPAVTLLVYHIQYSIHSDILMAILVHFIASGHQPPRLPQ